MSARVDVLAVLREAIALAEKHDALDLATRTMEARDAVGALLDADREDDEATTALYVAQGATAFHAAQRRLLANRPKRKAALARIGGGA